MKNIRVIVPAYDATNTIHKCINAIFKSTIINDIEVVVVDDGKNKNLEKILDQYPLDIIKSETAKGNMVGMFCKKASVAIARNKGALNFNGEILVFIDSDVEVKNDAIEKLVIPIYNKKADATVGNYSNDINNLNFFQSYKILYLNKTYSKEGYIKNDYWTALCAINNSIFIEMGCFSGYFILVPCEDTELGYRLSKNNKKIMAVPSAQGKHYKYYNFKKIVFNDLRKGINASSLSIKSKESLLHNRHVKSHDIIAVILSYLTPSTLFVYFLNPTYYNLIISGSIFILYIFIRLELISIYSNNGLNFFFKSIILTIILDLVRGISLIGGVTKYMLEQINSKLKIIRLIRQQLKVLFPGIHMPSYIMLFVTSRCNAKCPHCFFWQEKNSINNELTIDEIEKLAKSTGKVLQVTLTGGSPELRKDLPEIVKIFSKYCEPLNITICMNGYFTELIENHVKMIFDNVPNQRITIGLSLDGLFDEHDNLRKLNGSFKNVINTFECLRKIKINNPNLYIHCGIVISELNYKTASKTIHWAHNNLPLDMLKPTLVRLENQKEELLNQKVAETYFTLLEMENNQLNKNKSGFLEYLVKIKERILRSLYQDIYETGYSSIICSACRENITIYPSGDIVRCDLLPKPIENLRNYNMDLKKLWFSSDIEKVRKNIIDTNCSCYHHGYLSLAIFRTPRVWIKYAKTLLSKNQQNISHTLIIKT